MVTLLFVSLVWMAMLVDNISGQEESRVFSFQTEDQYRQENWTAGTSRGFFGWTDSNGEGIDIEFIADENGYRVIKKKNKLLLSRNPRDKDDAEEYEFEDEDDDGSSYRFAYNTGTSFREEIKRGGLIFGKYGFITADNKLHVVRYTASKKRGFIPVREVRDVSEFAAAYAEPSTPVPLRRLRAIATPVQLWPESDNIGNSSASVISTSPHPQTHLPTLSQNAIPFTSLPFPVKKPPVLPRLPIFSPQPPLILPKTSVATRLPQLSHTPPPPIPNRREPHVSRPIVKGKNQFAYNLGRHFHRQNETESGGVSGKYGWRDANGAVHVVHYVADDNGFKVIGRGKHFDNATHNP